MDDPIKELKNVTEKLIQAIGPYSNQIKHQYNSLQQLLDCLNSNDINSGNYKEAMVFYKSKFFIPHGGLSEFYIWKENDAERISINRPIGDLIDRLWESLDSY